MGSYLDQLEDDLRAHLHGLEARWAALAAEVTPLGREITRTSDAIRVLSGNKPVRPAQTVEPPPVEEREVTRREVVYVVERLPEPFKHQDVADALHVKLTDRVRGIVLDLEHEGMLRREGERRGLKWWRT